MKIFYDHQIFSLQNYGGISRYFCELIKGLKKNTDIQAELYLKYSNNWHLDGVPAASWKNFFKNNDFKGKAGFIKFINNQYSVNKIKAQDYDIFHPTYYNPYFLKHINGKPFVLTIYDMINEKFSRPQGKSDKMQLFKKILAQKAKKIIAISESTKKDIVDCFRIDPSKIEVIYLATSINPLTSTDSGIGEIPVLPEEYLLFVGKRLGYKNFMGFLKAALPLMNNNKGLNIVCAGGGKFSNVENKMFKEYGISRRISQFPVSSDEELKVFYRKAAVFVYPSLYEGFGIPILESFACRCPVLAAYSSSVPEVAGDAAVYFDPVNSESIKKAIASTLNNDLLRQDLVVKGLEQLKKFSWEKTAQRTKELYLDVIQV